MNRKVVVTGIGCIAPRAPSAPTFWQAMLQAHSLLGPIQRFDTTGYRTKIGGEIDFDISSLLGFNVKAISRNSQFSVAAAKEALECAGMATHPALAEAGICLGSGLGGCTSARIH